MLDWNNKTSHNFIHLPLFDCKVNVEVLGMVVFAIEFLLVKAAHCVNLLKTDLDNIFLTSLCSFQFSKLSMSIEML